MILLLQVLIDIEISIIISIKVIVLPVCLYFSRKINGTLDVYSHFTYLVNQNHHDKNDNHNDTHLNCNSISKRTTRLSRFLCMSHRSDYVLAVELSYTTESIE